MKGRLPYADDSLFKLNKKLFFLPILNKIRVVQPYGL